MDTDMQLAAAYAAGAEPPPSAFAGGPQRGAQPRRQQQQHVGGDQEMELAGELPNVDDLEVAAAAAGVAPVPAALAELGYFEMGPPPGKEQQMEEDSSSAEGSSSEEEASSSSEEEDGVEHAVAAALVRLELRALDDGTVAVRLLPARGDAGGGEAEFAADSGYESSSSSVAEEEAAEGGGSDADSEPVDVIENYEEIKRMIDDMDADVDAELDGEGGGGGGHRPAAEELLGALPLPSLAALQIAPDEPVQAAGVVQSLLEGMVVIKAQGGSRALSEGCVLVLEDRTAIGCIEEIFGPVVSPFYALRYAGAEPMPAALAQGATVYSVDRLADFVLPEELRVRGYDAGLEEEEGEGDLEAQFSDDEAEAQAWRRMEAKRKELPGGLQLGRQGAKQAGRGGGGRGGRGGRGRRGGRGGHQHVQPPMQQQQPQVAFYHPHQQQPAPPPPAMPAAGRVFSGRLQRPQPAFQAHATAAQLSGMALQQQHQQHQPGMHMQQPGYASGFGGAHYGQPVGMLRPPQPVTGQVLRPQYAGPAPPRPLAFVQLQYAGQPMMQQPAAPPPMFTPQLPFPPPPPPHQ